MKELRIFKTTTGKLPFSEWLSRLKNIQDRARIRRRIDRLAMGQYGDCKRIDKELYELRLFFGPGYRVYFTERESEIIILLLGGDKSTQKKDIKKAQEYLKLLVHVGEKDHEQLIY